MASTTDERPTGGSLSAAISNAIVRITSEYIGRGPTKARTSIRNEMIVVLMQDTLTKAEKSLLNARRHRSRPLRPGLHRLDGYAARRDGRRTVTGRLQSTVARAAKR
jgi:hypothetical protein